MAPDSRPTGETSEPVPDSRKFRWIWHPASPAGCLRVGCACCHGRRSWRPRRRPSRRWHSRCLARHRSPPNRQHAAHRPLAGGWPRRAHGPGPRLALSRQAWPLPCRKRVSSSRSVCGWKAPGLRQDRAQADSGIHERHAHPASASANVMSRSVACLATYRANGWYPVMLSTDADDHWCRAPAWIQHRRQGAGTASGRDRRPCQRLPTGRRTGIGRNGVAPARGPFIIRSPQLPTISHGPEFPTLA
jgi:hypothetical protein